MSPDGAIWSSLPVPAFLIDEGDRVTAANPAAEAFLNLSARSLIGAPVLSRIAIDAALGEAFLRVRRDDAPVFINTVEVAAEGPAAPPPVRCNVQIAPLAGSPGHLLLVLEPRQIADRLGRALAVKSATRSAIGMAEMLAHEIKNPLAGITGAAQLLAGNLGPADRELTDLIVAESRRIVALLDQVEQFGNLRPPQRRAVNIHDILDRARRLALVGFGAHMRILEDYDPSLPPAWADEDQMLQVVLNLLKNASEASDKTGTICIRTCFDPGLRLRRPDGSGTALPLQVEISDDGPGIPPAIAALVFEPFVSGRDNGTGLGLALVSRILSDHDACIAVEQAPRRTLFRISLPVAPKSARESA